MQVGDLVWHVDDLKCNDEIPGVITCLFESVDYARESATVHFVDRPYTETHIVDELVTDISNWSEDENTMGNP